MRVYEIRPCRHADIRALLPKLRAGDRAEAEAAGMEPRHLLSELYRRSFFARAASVEGEPAAIWGCLGPRLTCEGEAWLFTASAIERVPLAFFREARREVAQMLEIKSSLVTGVLRDYDCSIRFWKLMGFVPVGEYELGGSAFLKLRIER